MSFPPKNQDPDTIPFNFSLSGSPLSSISASPDIIPSSDTEDEDENMILVEEAIDDEETEDEDNPRPSNSWGGKSNPIELDKTQSTGVLPSPPSQSEYESYTGSATEYGVRRVDSDEIVTVGEPSDRIFALDDYTQSLYKTMFHIYSNPGIQTSMEMLKSWSLRFLFIPERRDAYLIFIRPRSESDTHLPNPVQETTQPKSWNIFQPLNLFRASSSPSSSSSSSIDRTQWKGETVQTRVQAILKLLKQDAIGYLGTYLSTTQPSKDESLVTVTQLLESVFELEPTFFNDIQRDMGFSNIDQMQMIVFNLDQMAVHPSEVTLDSNQRESVNDFITPASRYILPNILATFIHYQLVPQVAADPNYYNLFLRDLERGWTFIRELNYEDYNQFLLKTHQTFFERKNMFQKTFIALRGYELLIRLFSLERQKQISTITYWYNGGIVPYDKEKSDIQSPTSRINVEIWNATSTYGIQDHILRDLSQLTSVMQSHANNSLSPLDFSTNTSYLIAIDVTRPKWVQETINSWQEFTKQNLALIGTRFHPQTQSKSMFPSLHCITIFFVPPYTNGLHNVEVILQRQQAVIQAFIQSGQWNPPGSVHIFNEEKDTLSHWDFTIPIYPPEKILAILNGKFVQDIVSELLNHGVFSSTVQERRKTQTPYDIYMSIKNFYKTTTIPLSEKIDDSSLDFPLAQPRLDRTPPETPQKHTLPVSSSPFQTPVRQVIKSTVPATTPLSRGYATMGAPRPTTFSNASTPSSFSQLNSTMKKNQGYPYTPKQVSFYINDDVSSTATTPDMNRMRSTPESSTMSSSSSSSSKQSKPDVSRSLETLFKSMPPYPMSTSRSIIETPSQHRIPTSFPQVSALPSQPVQSSSSASPSSVLPMPPQREVPASLQQQSEDHLTPVAVLERYWGVGKKQVITNDGGGDCLFLSISRFLFGDERHHGVLRRLSIWYILQVLSSPDQYTWFTSNTLCCEEFQVRAIKQLISELNLYHESIHGTKTWPASRWTKMFQKTGVIGASIRGEGKHPLETQQGQQSFITQVLFQGIPFEDLFVSPNEIQKLVFVDADLEMRTRIEAVEDSEGGLSQDVKELWDRDAVKLMKRKIILHSVDLTGPLLRSLCIMANSHEYAFDFELFILSKLFKFQPYVVDSFATWTPIFGGTQYPKRSEPEGDYLDLKNYAQEPDNVMYIFHYKSSPYDFGTHYEVILDKSEAQRRVTARSGNEDMDTSAVSFQRKEHALSIIYHQDYAFLNQMDQLNWTHFTPYIHYSDACPITWNTFKQSIHNKDKLVFPRFLREDARRREEERVKEKTGQQQLIQPPPISSSPIPIPTESSVPPVRTNHEKETVVTVYVIDSRTVFHNFKHEDRAYEEMVNSQIMKPLQQALQMAKAKKASLRFTSFDVIRVKQLTDVKKGVRGILVFFYVLEEKRPLPAEPKIPWVEGERSILSFLRTWEQSPLNYAKFLVLSRDNQSHTLGAELPANNILPERVNTTNPDILIAIRSDNLLTTNQVGRWLVTSDSSLVEQGMFIHSTLNQQTLKNLIEYIEETIRLRDWEKPIFPFQFVPDQPVIRIRPFASPSPSTTGSTPSASRSLFPRSSSPNLPSSIPLETKMEPNLNLNLNPVAATMPPPISNIYAFDWKTPHNKNFRLSMRYSNEKGWGVFAEQKIPKDTYLADYQGELLPAADVNKSRDYDQNTYLFVFSLPKVTGNRQWVIDAQTVPINEIGSGKLKYGIGRYFNHAGASKANLKTHIINSGKTLDVKEVGGKIMKYPQDVHIRIYTTKDVLPDQELTMSYGLPEHWTDIQKKKHPYLAEL